jgi:hypothetical protein
MVFADSSPQGFLFDLFGSCGGLLLVCFFLFAIASAFKVYCDYADKKDAEQNKD